MTRSFVRRTLLAIFPAAFLMGTAALAQPPGRGGFDPKMMIDRQVGQLKDELKLSADQEKQVRGILEEQMKKQMALREKMEPGQPPSDEVRQEMTKIREDGNTQMAKVLDEKQLEKYEKIQAERRGRMGGPGGGRRGPQREQQQQ